MKILSPILLGLLLLSGHAFAQTSIGKVVAGCGGQTLTPGTTYPFTVDLNGNPCPPAASTSAPLPSNAAQETGGNLATIATGTGAPADAAYSGSGSSSIIAALKGIYAATVAALPSGANLLGKVGIDQTTPGSTNAVAPTLSPTLTAPQSTLTRPANTTGYTGTATTPQLIGSSATAGSVVVPTFNIATSNGQALIPRLSLTSNVTVGWGGVSVVVTLWTAAPTYTNGDVGAYAVATNASKFRAQYACTFIQYTAGAVASCAPLVGSAPLIHPDTAAVVAWDMQITSSATPISGQTFTLTPEVWN